MNRATLTPEESDAIQLQLRDLKAQLEKIEESF
jgi:hypothetical protein